MLKKALIVCLALVPVMGYAQKYDEAVKKMKGMPATGYTLLDVRSMEEFKVEALPGAMNCPVDMVSKSLKQIDKTKPVFVYAAKAEDAEKAVAVLVKAKYEAYAVGVFMDLKIKPMPVKAVEPAKPAPAKPAPAKPAPAPKKK